jgi:uncharacterized protein YbaP (TraB family)
MPTLVEIAWMTATVRPRCCRRCSARRPPGRPDAARRVVKYAAINARAADRHRLAALDRSCRGSLITLLQVELAKRGFSPELGIEQTLAARASRDHKPIQGLETAEEQFAVMARLPLARQKRFLMMTLEESEQIDEQLDELLQAWRTGDTATLARVLTAEFDDFPELYRPLTEDRNRAWVDRLVDLLDDRDDYLVVVGALHLVGRHSVVELLEQRGYEVVQQ